MNRLAGLFAGLVKRFAQDTRGAFAVIFGVMAIVLVALSGSAVDYTLWQNAVTSARTAADAGALAGAISDAQDLASIRQIVIGAAANTSPFADISVSNVAFDTVKDQVEVTVEGEYSTLFVTLVGVHTMPVRAVATSERAQPGALEIALVLDNTYSMSGSDGAGGTKIAALKTASRNLVDILWEQDEAGTIDVALVPYADYVNVGVANRTQPWMTVPADYSTTSPRTCTKHTTRTVCVRRAPSQTCTRTVDGVPENYECGNQCLESRTDTVPEYETCSGGGTTHNRWYGCVYSRRTGTLRLNDTLPNSPYTGFLGTSQRCLNPVVPLTQDRTLIRNSLAGMIVNIGTGYRPLTYIPAGMVWGINVLSPTAPFVEAEAYDPAKLRPRKALVLMTDGDNTLRFVSSNGTHTAFTGTAAQQATLKTQTDTDTSSLCTYAKNQGIEVFTVAFGTLLPASDALLAGCASDANHYFSAANPEELNAAFEQIGEALKFVRLVK